MPNKSRGTLIREGRNRGTAIEQYINEPFPIVDKNNLEKNFMPDADERFVPLFHYKDTKLKNRNERKGVQSSIYIVSDKGNVITFDTPDRPEVMKKVLTVRARGEMSYLKCGDDWDIHKLVWFSFAADAIINNTALPKFYRIHKSFWTLEGLLELSTLGSPEYGKLVMVHHMDLNPQNNELNNLELLPNNEDNEISEAWHSWLHDLQNMTEEEKADSISQKRITEQTIIFADPDFLSISELQNEQWDKLNQKGYFDLIQIRVSILKKIAEEKKGEYFKKQRIISVQTDKKIEIDRFSAEVVGTTLKIENIDKSIKTDCIFELKAI